MDEGGEATTEFPVDELSVAEGLHVYVDAPNAFNVAESETQMLGLLPLMVGGKLTSTFVVTELVHPFPSLPTIVYTVLVVGFAITVLPVVLSNPVAGVHE